jgi:hypothetical protein
MENRPFPPQNRTPTPIATAISKTGAAPWSTVRNFSQKENGGLQPPFASLAP